MAKWFGVQVGPPLKIPLTAFMPQHKDTWSHIRQKYHLKDLPYDRVQAITLILAPNAYTKAAGSPLSST